MSFYPDCTSDSCSPEAGKVQAALFTEFHRSFLWTISGPDGTLLGLDFSGTGLKDVPESEACEDGYLYSVSKTDAEGAVQTQNYCRNGTVTHLDLPSKASVSVVVPPQGEVLPTVFSLAPKPKPVKSKFKSATVLGLGMRMNGIGNYLRMYNITL